jgi:hypothetical protein
MLRSSSLVLSKRYRSRCSTRQEALCRLSKTCLCLNVSKLCTEYGVPAAPY